MITCSNTSKRGAILVFTALISTAILAVTAIVVDIGYLYYKKNDLQTAVNAAWLAGNDRLMKLKSTNPVLTKENKEAIRNHIIEVMKYNGFEANDQNRVNCSIKDDKDLHISANSHVGLFFAKVIEVDSTTVAASRESDTTGTGVADILPIVMPHGITKWNADNTLSFQFFPKDGGFIEGKEYIIKPGQISDSSVLCQGITDFTSAGSVNNKDYIKNMTYGFTKALNVNDKITLACTGYSKETTEALNQRFTKENNTKVIIPIGEVTEEMATIYGNNANTLPIYNLRSPSSNSTQNVAIANAARITGFAEFKLLKESEFTRTGSDYKNGDEGSLGAAKSGQLRGIFLGYIVNPNQLSK